ncbi:HNH endonuclease signature motif containing protein [Sphingobium sp. YC-XJ3]|uniref:HNH endonuclease signature motif containing protein n=1 Tax=Sphingobium sp. YC-XJ3 TaxID=3024245 RepID=UPI003FCF1BDE
MRKLDVRPIKVRLMERISVEGECWFWTGTINPKGYGSLSVRGRCNLAHRLSYEAFCGPIGDGLQIDHLCRNRACINPDHLEAVTASENCKRAAPFHPGSRPRTHCLRGHEFAGDNLFVGRGGKRYCRACCRIREASRRHYRPTKQAERAA